MVFLGKSFRPDPFRFRPPKIKRWLYWFFHLQNLYLLYVKFQFSKLCIPTEDLRILRQIRPGERTLLLSNHTNYADPHVMFELSFKAKFCPKWLAGIEPFDTAYGIFGWFIQSAGAFSIDRGILDRFALETAQAVLDDGKHPLVIYPEGEAAYTNKVLQPFYPGAAVFAISTAEKQLGANQLVRVVPMAIRYQFIGSPEKTLQRGIDNFYRYLDERAAHAGVLLPPIAFQGTLWDNLMAALRMGLTYLQHVCGEDLTPSHASDAARIEGLRDVLLERLCQEHQPQAALQDLTLEALMDLKNKLRSIIARKRYAPPLETLRHAISQVDLLADAAKNNSLSRREMKGLTQLEMQWIGIANTGGAVEKRLKVLAKHLKQQMPYAMVRHDAQPEDLVRWKKQINQTRQVKLLTLLLEDLKRRDESWEGLDETLVKLEILFLDRFVYRGKKEAQVRVGAPMDVKAFLLQHDGLSRRELQALLMESVRTQMETLLHAASFQPSLPSTAQQASDLPTH